MRKLFLAFAFLFVFGCQQRETPAEYQARIAYEQAQWNAQEQQLAQQQPGYVIQPFVAPVYDPYYVHPVVVHRHVTVVHTSPVRIVRPVTGNYVRVNPTYIQPTTRYGTTLGPTVTGPSSVRRITTTTVVSPTTATRTMAPIRTMTPVVRTYTPTPTRINAFTPRSTTTTTVTRTYRKK